MTFPSSNGGFHSVEHGHRHREYSDCYLLEGYINMYYNYKTYLSKNVCKDVYTVTKR